MDRKWDQGMKGRREGVPLTRAEFEGIDRFRCIGLSSTHQNVKNTWNCYMNECGLDLCSIRFIVKGLLQGPLIESNIELLR